MLIAQVIALKDQAHALQQGMHVYKERKEQDKPSTLQLEPQVPQILALAFVATQ
jgi:hypothetical protein